ncbi:hypothetical protein QAD02_017415 [Eretmocerus hayati]|uniref:Uncharacterized protein n=1 Tax=Eretmocerus hayati TaxID=131215 RepID=A0ACC2PDT4_9HYME|nr:hypothetical protein QAD02_017415 [Eretmocerus hayati]
MHVLHTKLQISSTSYSSCLLARDLAAELEGQLQGGTTALLSLFTERDDSAKIELGASAISFNPKTTVPNHRYTQLACDVDVAKCATWSRRIAAANRLDPPRASPVQPVFTAHIQGM